MIAQFEGRNRSEKADEFVAEVEAQGGTVYDRYLDENAYGDLIVIVEYEEADEE